MSKILGTLIYAGALVCGTILVFNGLWNNAELNLSPFQSLELGFLIYILATVVSIRQKVKE